MHQTHQNAKNNTQALVALCAARAFEMRMCMMTMVL